jgi:hypothetical protein
MDPMGVTLRVHQDTEPSSQFAVELEYRKRVLAAFEAAGIMQASITQMTMLGQQLTGPGSAPAPASPSQNPDR